MTSASSLLKVRLNYLIKLASCTYIKKYLKTEHSALLQEEQAASLVHIKNKKKIQTYNSTSKWGLGNSEISLAAALLVPG